LTTYLGKDIPEYETEWSRPKILSRGRVGIGFAGTSLYADMALSSLGNQISDFAEIVENISTFVKNMRKEITDNEIKRVTRIEADNFFENEHANIPEKIKEYIYGMLMEFRFDFNCIVAGFNKDGIANIYLIGDEGDKNCFTNFGMCAIGSGDTFSQIFFDQNQYDISMTEVEALLFAFKAKKWSEAPTGVGTKTDIILLRENGSKIEIKDEDLLMRDLYKIYEKEKEIMKRERTKLLGVFKKKMEG
jgi:20S proteasome alpha/beta subunit